MPCYFQRCSATPTTREHIPPKSFFPDDQRKQLLTVPSCERHNGAKSTDDIYVLAHICMNASPANRSRELFMERVAPQLHHNDGALRRRIAAGAVRLPNGSVAYPVDISRFHSFFDALSFGLVFNSCKAVLPSGYRVRHIFHNFKSGEEEPEWAAYEAAVIKLYGDNAMDVLDFGQVKTWNAPVYSAKLFGVPGFRSSITIVHDFYDVFRVTSFLTQPAEFSPMDGSSGPA